MLKHFYLIFFIYLLFLFPIKLDIIRTSKFLKVDCYPEPARIRNVTCNIKPITHETTLANFNCDLVKPVKNIFIHYKLFKWSNGFQPYLVDFKVDMCQILKFRKSQLPLLQVIFDLLQKYSNFNHTCPYKGRLIVKDMKIDVAAMPVYFPRGDYRLNASISDRTSRLGSGAIYFVLSEKNVAG